MINISSHSSTVAAMRTNLVRKWHLHGHFWHKLSSLERHNFRTRRCRIMPCTSFKRSWDALQFGCEQLHVHCLLSMAISLERPKIDNDRLSLYLLNLDILFQAVLNVPLQSIVVDGKFWCLPDHRSGTGNAKVTDLRIRQNVCWQNAAGKCSWKEPMRRRRVTIEGPSVPEWTPSAQINA